jgi:hypothetical protein
MTIPNPLRYLPLAIASIVLLGGCASAPKAASGSLIAADATMEHTRGQPQSLRERRLDRAAIAQARTVHIQAPVFAGDVGVPLTPREREVLLAGLARKLCLRIADYFEVVSADRPADLVIRSEITGVGVTSLTAAAASLVGGALSPVPFTPRLPAGLGGLAVNVIAQRNDGSEVLALRWAQGANAFTTDATPSRIGDAYELADELATDMRKLLREQGEAGQRPRPRPRIDRKLRSAGESECETAFGRIDPAAMLARYALPLTPEMIEPEMATKAAR